MCRALLYLGEPVLIDHLLYQTDSSLVKQSYMPRMLQMLNLAGLVLWLIAVSCNSAAGPPSDTRPRH